MHRSESGARTTYAAHRKKALESGIDGRLVFGSKKATSVTQTGEDFRSVPRSRGRIGVSLQGQQQFHLRRINFFLCLLHPKELRAIHFGKLLHAS